jgi:hypothetical protein
MSDVMVAVSMLFCLTITAGSLLAPLFTLEEV